MHFSLKVFQMSLGGFKRLKTFDERELMLLEMRHV